MAPKAKEDKKPVVVVDAKYLGVVYSVSIPIPKWAKHKGEGEPPPDAEALKKYEEEGGDSMWELHLHEQGQKLAQKQMLAKAKREEAELKAQNDVRLAKLKASFDVFDTSGDGQLDAAEVLQILTRMTAGGTPLTEADANEFIKEFDRDGDGQLSVDEFIIAMGVVSDAHDSDGDGQADFKQAGVEAQYEGKEDEFAEKLAEGEQLVVAGLQAGNVAPAVDEARRQQAI